MLSLLSLVLPAFATDDLDFSYAQSAAVPEGVHVLAPRDEVGDGGSRDLLRQLSFDTRDLGADVLPPSLDGSPDPTCTTGGADGYLVLRALRWTATFAYEPVELEGAGFSVAEATGLVTTSTPDGWTQSGSRDVQVGAARMGVRALVTLVGDADWAITDCAGQTLQGWTQRELVHADADGHSEAEARAHVDLDALRDGRGVTALAKAARRSLTRPPEDHLSRPFFDTGCPELEAAAELLHRRDGRDWAPAVHLWATLAARPATTPTESRNVARAVYNLALDAERRRAYPEAAALAHTAALTLRADWIAVYAAELDALAATAGVPVPTPTRNASSTAAPAAPGPAPASLR